MELKHCPIIAITNQKGGVGKTTTTINLSHALALQGVRVLVLDMDPHGNLTQGLGCSIDALAHSVRDLIEDRTSNLEQMVIKIRPNLNLIGANPLLSGTARWLITQTNGELRLKHRLSEVQALYDLILIDTCPGLGTLLNSVLNAANYLILPVDTGIFGYLGLRELQAEVREIRAGTNPGLETLGYLLTLSDRTVVARETWDALVSQYGDLVFETQIRRCVSLKESPAFGRSIFEHAAKSTGALDYLQLAAEVMHRLEGSRKVLRLVHAFSEVTHG